MVTADDGVYNTETCRYKTNDCILICFKMFQSIVCNYINKLSALVGVSRITRMHGAQSIKIVHLTLESLMVTLRTARFNIKTMYV